MRFLPAQGKLARYRAVLAGKNGLLSIVVLGNYTAAMASCNAVCVRHCQAWMSPVDTYTLLLPLSTTKISEYNLSTTLASIAGQGLCQPVCIHTCK